MSVRIMTMCYDARFGSSSRKAVAVALADHADDNGEHVYPSVAALAYKTELAGRTVQRALRDLEEMGLIVVMSGGGQGPKDTREWRFDLGVLGCLIMGDSVSPIDPSKGDTVPPSKGDGVSPSAPLRVTLSPKKGDTVPPEPSGTIKKKDARARDGSKMAVASARHPARPVNPRRGPERLGASLPPIPPPRPPSRSPAVACGMAELAASLRAKGAARDR